jgi:hypothetical protein
MMSMPDQSEPERRRRTRGDSNFPGAGPVASKSDVSQLEDRGLRASKDSIKAVSDLLLAKKDAWTRPSTPIRIPVLEGPASPGEATRRPVFDPSIRANFDLPQASVGPAPSTLPDREGGDEPRSVEPRRRELPGMKPSSGVHSPPTDGANPGPTQAGGTIAPTVSPIRKPIESIGGFSLASDVPKDEGVSNSRLQSSVPHPFTGGLASDDPKGINAHPKPDSQPAIGSVTRSLSTHDGGREPTVAHSGLSVPSSVAAVDLPRDPAGGQAPSDATHRVELPGNGSGLTGTGMRADHLSAPAIHSDPASNVVRNPLSAELRNFSMASADHLEQGGMAQGQGGSVTSPGENSFGVTTSSQGGCRSISPRPTNSCSSWSTRSGNNAARPCRSAVHRSIRTDENPAHLSMMGKSWPLMVVWGSSAPPCR